MKLAESDETLLWQKELIISHRCLPIKKLLCNTRISQLKKPRHDKTNNMACVPSQDQSLRCPHEETLAPQWRPWSDWSDAHADLSLRWVHRSFGWFCRETAQMATVSVLIWAMSRENLLSELCDQVRFKLAASATESIKCWQFGYSNKYTLLQ